jgi:hypothetical protein
MQEEKKKRWWWFKPPYSPDLAPGDPNFFSKELESFPRYSCFITVEPSRNIFKILFLPFTALFIKNIQKEALARYILRNSWKNYFVKKSNKTILFDTSLESESVCIVTSGWRFLFRSLHFRSSFFAHCLSLTGFHLLVIFSNFLGNIWYSAALVSFKTSSGTYNSSSSISTISTTCTQPLYWRYRRCLFCILFFSIATDPSKHVIYFYFKFWIQHLRLRLLSFTWIASSTKRARNSRERKLCFPHSHCK